MPETTYQALRSANANIEVGDVHHHRLITHWTDQSDRIEIGTDGDKTPLTRDNNTLFETIDIPLGSKINQWMFRQLPQETNTGASFDVDVDVMAIDPRNSRASVIYQPEKRAHQN